MRAPMTTRVLRRVLWRLALLWRRPVPGAIRAHALREVNGE